MSTAAKNGAKVLNVTSLRQQVYEYLRDEINLGNLTAGSNVDMTKICKHLGISRTPLRDALIQLECEGFVTILPRRGVVVKKLTLEDVKNSWEICRALELEVLRNVFTKITPSHISSMRRINARMEDASRKEDIQRYYQLNVDFHHVFVDLSDNDPMKQLLGQHKKFLYDFHKMAHLSELESKNILEHEQFLKHIENREQAEAANLLHDVHWSFEAQVKFIREFYLDNFDDEKELLRFIS